MTPHLLRCCLSAWSERDSRENSFRYRRRLSRQGTQEPLKIPYALLLNAYRTPYQDEMGLHVMEGCDIHCFSTRTVVFIKQLLPAFEIHCSYKCAFEHWKTNKLLQKKKKMWEPLSNFVNCLFITCVKKQSDMSLSCSSSLCLDLFQLN